MITPEEGKELHRAAIIATVTLAVEAAVKVAVKKRAGRDLTPQELKERGKEEISAAGLFSFCLDGEVIYTVDLHTLVL